MVSESFGFTGPYICWAVQGTLGNSDSQWIITITKDSPNTLTVILIKVTFSFKHRRKISGIFQIFPGSTLPKPRYPSQGTQAMLTQETKKVWTLQPKPSHARGAKCEEQLEQCSLTQWLHNQTSCTCAALQQQRSSTEEQQTWQQQQQGGWGATPWHVCCITQYHCFWQLSNSGVKLNRQK